MEERARWTGLRIPFFHYPFLDTERIYRLLERGSVRGISNQIAQRITRLFFFFFLQRGRGKFVVPPRERNENFLFPFDQKPRERRGKEVSGWIVNAEGTGRYAARCRRAPSLNHAIHTDKIIEESDK